MGGTLAPVTDHRLGIWGKTWSGVYCSGMVCLVPDRKGADHITEKRCSGLELLGCDPGSGYTVLRFNTQNWLIALCGYGITARAASSSRQALCNTVYKGPLGPVWSPSHGVVVVDKGNRCQTFNAKRRRTNQDR